MCFTNLKIWREVLYENKKNKKNYTTLNQGGVLKTDSKLKTNSKFVSQ